MSSRVLLIFRIIVGGVFIFAALTKIPNAGALAKAMEQFHLVPQPLVLPFSYFLPWLEFFCGVALIFGIWLPAARAVGQHSADRLYRGPGGQPFPGGGV